MIGSERFDWLGVVMIALLGISSVSGAPARVQDRTSALVEVAAADVPLADVPSPDTPPTGVPLYDDLGDHQRAITTSSPKAQAYFDQGLRLQYAFNHAEAVRSYDAALEFDAECAMCWWGLALAEGH